MGKVASKPGAGGCKAGDDEDAWAGQREWVSCSKVGYYLSASALLSLPFVLAALNKNIATQQ